MKHKPKFSVEVKTIVGDKVVKSIPAPSKYACKKLANLWKEKIDLKTHYVVSGQV